MRYFVTGGSGFIGLNLVEGLIEAGETVLNVDTRPPGIESHIPFWREGDIMNAAALEKLLSDFQPSHVIHLAARTDTLSDRLGDYACNVDGTRNVLSAVAKTASVKRVIVTSTQFVNQYHGAPEHDQDFNPHTAYGESKVLAEQITRKAHLDLTWTIIRPTNIWGPWHPRYPQEFWRVLSKGLYFHPGKGKVLRSYGYVKNVVYQILQIANAPVELVNEKVYYVGDSPIDLYEWVDGFSLGQTGRHVRVVPRSVVRALAMLGDVLARVGVVFPITSSRFKSMTTSNAAPMGPVLKEFGAPPYTLDAGIAETIEWLRVYHPELVKVAA